MLGDFGRFYFADFDQTRARRAHGARADRRRVTAAAKGSTGCDDLGGARELQSGWAAPSGSTNAAFEAVVTLDVGPRIMHVCSRGAEHVRRRLPLQRRPARWCASTEYLWRASGLAQPGGVPSQLQPPTIIPSQRYELFADGVLLVQDEEPWTQSSSRSSCASRICRSPCAAVSPISGAWPIEMAVWSLSLGSPGGPIDPPVGKKHRLLPDAH